MKEDTRSRERQADRASAERRRSEETTTRSGKDNPNLFPLNDLDDYKVASDDPDVRGWDIISGDNERIGKVKELIVDTKRMKVRYLAVKPGDKFIPDSVENKDFQLLIPVGAARLHEEDNDVIVSNIRVDSLSHYPPYYGDRITREEEQGIRRFFEAGGTVPTTSTTSTEKETIRDAHTGKIYERQDRSAAAKSGVDSNSRNRVDVVTGTSGDVNAQNPGEEGKERRHGTGQMSDLPQEDRIQDRAQTSSNTIRGNRAAEDRRPDDKTALGSFNHTSPNEVRDRVSTSGISSSRTSNLPNKDLEQGPTGKETAASRGAGKANISEEDRVRIHDTDPNVETPKGSGAGNKDDFNSTSNLNRSTSKGDDFRRGSNEGNVENRERTPGMQDRSRMSSPEFTDRTSTPGDSRHPDKYPEGSRPVRKEDLTHSSDELPDDRYDPETDEFYTHDHFDEDRFYGNRRKRRDE